MQGAVEYFETSDPRLEFEVDSTSNSVLVFRGHIHGKVATGVIMEINQTQKVMSSQQWAGERIITYEKPLMDAVFKLSLPFSVYRRTH